MVDGRFKFLYTGKPDKQVVDTFEKEILETLVKETKEFYAKIVHDQSNLPVTDFLDLGNKYLDEEQERIDK